MTVLHTLRRDAENGVRDAFDFGVEGYTGVGQDDEEELWASTDRVSRLHKRRFEGTFDVAGGVGVEDGWGTVLNLHTEFGAGVAEFFDEVFADVGGAVAFVHEADNAPSFEGGRGEEGLVPVLCCSGCRR